MAMSSESSERSRGFPCGGSRPRQIPAAGSEGHLMHLKPFLLDAWLDAYERCRPA